MPWQWLDQRTIRHTDGHTIELKSGSWKTPMDIDPRFASILDGITSVRLIRAGLEFAASTNPGASKTVRGWKNPSSDNSDSAGKPTQRSRPVLSLKKEKILD